jgi:hypothetical protein
MDKTVCRRDPLILIPVRGACPRNVNRPDDGISADQVHRCWTTGAARMPSPVPVRGEACCGICDVLAVGDGLRVPRSARKAANHSGREGSALPGASAMVASSSWIMASNEKGWGTHRLGLCRGEDTDVTAAGQRAATLACLDDQCRSMLAQSISPRSTPAVACGFVVFLAQQIVVALLQRAAAKPFAADYLSSQ